MAGRYRFVIVGKDDNPLFEDEYGWSSKRGDKQKDDRGFFQRFLMHAALDAVDLIVWDSTQMYHKVVDRVNEWSISAFSTASGIRFMLLHDLRNEDGIRNFFVEVHDLYIKILLNPFYTPGTIITHAGFREKLKNLAKKCL
eukprot:m.10431 g.10431  ORF g.10431 m.10431 type:complete len:141 (+) comp8300_c0_seq2:416-838(+)